MSPTTVTRPLQVADLFCGAGGFSTAVLEALGEDRVNLVALNHWDRAIATHNANHSGGERADLYDADPLTFVPGGELDLLVASPTCTFFSRARGGKPVSWDQRKGRMTPTQVVRWVKALKVKRLIVENVPEFLDWGPVSRETGKPRKERKGCNFRGWIRDLREAGFKAEWTDGKKRPCLNAADFGDATTRTRFFLMARSDGGPIRWPEPTHTKTGPFGARFKRWRAAREVIDWKRRGKSIFTRAKPLAPKTLLRIYAGVVRFGWPRAFRVKLALYMRSLGIDVPADLVPQGNLFDPAVLVLRRHADMRSVDAPLPAVTAGGTHLGVVEPLDTVVTKDFKGVVEPLVLRTGMHSSNALCVREAGSPLATVTTDGGLAVVEPWVLNRHGENGATRAHSIDGPLPTATARGAGYVVEPFTFANRTGNAPRGAGEPIAPPVTSGGVGLVEPFLLSQGAGGAPRAASEPVPTIPTEGAHALVVPVTHDDASMRARSTDDPLPTVTSAARGELGFVVGAFGERPGQTPRVHSIEEPAPTLCAQGRIPLVHGVTAEELEAVDILFRMLEPDELALAMGFPKLYRFTGNKTERTRQIGNAVAVNLARALVAALMECAA